MNNHIKDSIKDKLSSIMNIKRWYKRNFCILTMKECMEMNLIHSFNLYGDGINMFNCRSFWKDEKGRLYRCENLIPKDANI